MSFDRRGAGEPLLLLHGTGSSRAIWAPVLDMLAAERGVIAVDLPGHGQSPLPRPELPPTPIGYARALAELLDELGLEAAHVVGNSVGGWTALELAKLDRARSVVALAPAGLWRRRDPFRCTAQLWLTYRLARLFAPLTPYVLRSSVGRAIALGGSFAKPRQIPAEVAIAIDQTYRGTRGFDAHLAATRRERFKDGHRITVPVTVAWGEKERLIPVKARLRDELPPYTRFVKLPGCGHVMMWDDPESVARTILEGTATPAFASKA